MPTKLIEKNQAEIIYHRKNQKKKKNPEIKFNSKPTVKVAIRRNSIVHM